MARRLWTPALALALAGVAAAGFWILPVRGAASAVPAGRPPCGGEAVSEDTFPALTAAQTAEVPANRPESFLPDPARLEALQAKEGATVLMSQFSTRFTHASDSQAANIALTARKLAGTVIAPGAVFSYNAAAGPFTAAGGYGWGRMFVGDRIVPTIGGGVCQGASTLYNTVLLANLPVVERHQHGLTVPYLPPGRDATVTESGGLDFRFRNNTRWPLVLWAQAQDRTLTMAIYGHQAPPKVEIETKVLATYPFSTRYVRDPKLAPGEEQVVAPGQDGAKSTTWEIVETPQGPRRRLLSQDQYRPSPRIVLRGPTS